MKLFGTGRCEKKPFSQNNTSIDIFLEVKKMEKPQSKTLGIFANLPGNSVERFNQEYF